mmetsp:Transcript_27576/g.90215  ORF Transcript_27576/g.90215 Transcript_27576/m.90215 type:complete len:160 (-) Transcript_27576:157-636(-)
MSCAHPALCAPAAPGAELNGSCAPPPVVSCEPRGPSRERRPPRLRREKLFRERSRKERMRLAFEALVGPAHGSLAVAPTSAAGEVGALTLGEEVEAEAVPGSDGGEASGLVAAANSTLEREERPTLAVAADDESDVELALPRPDVIPTTLVGLFVPFNV